MDKFIEGVVGGGQRKRRSTSYVMTVKKIDVVDLHTASHMTHDRRQWRSP